MDDDYGFSFDEDSEEAIVAKQIVEEQSKLILSDKNNKKLFVNFFDLYAKDEFDNIYFLISCERQMHMSMFGNYFIEFKKYGDDHYQYFFCVNKYPPFVKLLVKNGILQNFDADNKYDEYYNYLLITVCLKYISQEYFANSFKELYGGFFSDIENLDVDKCVNAYYSIDFINHDDLLIHSQFVYFLSEFNNKINEICENLNEIRSLLFEKVSKYLDDKVQNDFENQLLNHGMKLEDSVEYNPYDNVTIDDVDQLDGIEFEHYVSYLFEKMGYSVVVTSASGDQGIDIIVAKNGISLGVQAKRYISAVTNTAIQEVVAGIKHYSLQKGVVVTNSNFTKSAMELAKSNDVILWDRNKLIEIIQTVKSMNNLF
ncbi:restriction endonuclease [Sporosarcina beigongshangi]|uniref:restriction endonuclease n=1 Tax=Sporosarcina beigongshangi TaxID=2782538 RepID=UPI001939EDCF|nr:restriction endonuclease [Sporosarcina beigongshangi]